MSPWVLLIVVCTIVVLWVLAAWAIRACDAANGADWGGRWWNRLDGLNRLFCRYYHHLRHEPVALPRVGPALVVANHMSGLDPLLMIAACDRPLRFMIAREQYERFGLKWLFRAIGCIPVERVGRPELALREALRALRGGEVVALFPHGRIHLDSDPPRKLKRGVAKLAQLSGCPIYPLRVVDVRGQGHTVAAVMMPSRARVYSFPPLHCDELSIEDCLVRVAKVIEGHHGAVHHG